MSEENVAKRVQAQQPRDKNKIIAALDGFVVHMLRTNKAFLGFTRYWKAQHYKQAAKRTARKSAGPPPG